MDPASQLHCNMLNFHPPPFMSCTYTEWPSDPSRYGAAGLGGGQVPAAGVDEPFPIDPQTQHRFLEGLDDVGITLTHADAIDAYEARRPAWLA